MVMDSGVEGGGPERKCRRLGSTRQEKRRAILDETYRVSEVRRLAMRRQDSSTVYQIPWV